MRRRDDRCGCAIALAGGNAPLRSTEATASIRRPPGGGTVSEVDHVSDMLCVPSYVAPSRIAGVGLFAARPLPAGTRVWQFTEGVDWRIAEGELALFPEPWRSQMKHYLYRDESGHYVLCGDNGKFMNHSDEPNCTDADPKFTVTLRDVRAHEELTCNYFEFDEESRQMGLPWLAARHEEAVTRAG